MSILDRIGAREVPERYKRPEDTKAAHLTMEVQKSDYVPKFNGHTFEQAYTTCATVQTTWYANGAQYDERRKIAHREIVELIYGPVLARLNRIVARAHDRDFESVIEEVSAIQKELTT